MEIDVVDLTKMEYKEKIERKMNIGQIHAQMW